MLTLLYIIFILYCLLRFYLLISYKKVLNLVFSEENKMKEAKKTAQEEVYNDIFMNHSKNIERLQKKYANDQNCKYFGALTIGISSLISVIYKSSDLIIMLPALLTLFNTFFERFEINLPWEYTQITAKFM